MSEKKKSGFIRFYAIFLLFLLLIVIVALAAVWIFLRGYQDDVEAAVNDEWKASQEAFEAYIDHLNYDAWADMWFEANPESLDSRNDIKDIIKEKLSEGITFARAKNYTDTDPVYVVENGDGTLAEFSLAKDPSGSWQVVSSRMRIKGRESAQITVPSGTDVFCNEVKLDDSCCISSESVFPFGAEYESKLENPVMLQTWEVTGQAVKPVMTVQAPDGTEVIDDNGTQVLGVDVSAHSEIRDTAKAFFDAFIKYGMYGYYDLQANADATARLCRKDSQAYNYVYTTQNAFQNAPCWSVYVFNRLTESPMIKWADNAYTIDFEYDIEATYRGTDKNYVSGEYRILVMDLGDGFEVCGILNQ